MSVPSNKELWLSWSALWNGNLSIADEIIAPGSDAYERIQQHYDAA